MSAVRVDADQRDAERLDARLRGGIGIGNGADLPTRLAELAGIAVELAEILARPQLLAAERDRIAQRAWRLASRRRLLHLPGPLPDVRRRSAVVVGAAGGTLLGLVVVVAALRRPQHGAPLSA